MNRGNICLEKRCDDLEFSVRTIFFLWVLGSGRKQHIAIPTDKSEDQRVSPYSDPQPVKVRLAWLYFPRQLPCGAINSTPIA